MNTVTTTVAFVRPEARNAATVRLKLPGPFDYKSGQALAIKPSQFDGLDDDKPRYFSFASHPLEEGYVEITVKIEEGATLAPHLVNGLKEGDTVEISGPAGRFTLPDSVPEGIGGLVHVCAGSAVVPIRGIIKHALAAKLGFRNLLFLQNKTEEDILYKDEFDQLEQKHPNLLKVVHIISQPGDAWTGRRGHLDLGVIGREMEGYLTTGECLAFVCGPNRPHPSGNGFLDTFAGNPKKEQPGVLAELGIPPDRIITERW